MKKHVSTIVLVIILIVGLCVLLYPSVSNYVNQRDASYAIDSYDASVSQLTDEQKADILAQAAAYNDKLAEKGNQSFQSGAPKDEEYESLLNVNGDGMIGYVTIKKLGVRLPIYHGTSDSVLVSGTGHLEGSSLPVGGTSTHAVITGHRGLPSAKLFTDLDKLEVGDTFTITVLNETLTYQVDQISIVEPDETDQLLIQPDEDHVTLLTCTPYAINTQRLLVRGVRIAGDNTRFVPADAVQVNPLIAMAIVAVPILLVLLVVLLASSKRRDRRNSGGRNDGEVEGT